MLGDDDNEKSERLIPAGTEDSAAIDADDIKRLKQRSIAKKNDSVGEISNNTRRDIHEIRALPAIPMAAVPAASFVKQQQQPQQQQMQRSQQQQQQRRQKQARPQQQIATNDDEESYVYEPKKGHNLFFFLCDTKRAVIILSGFDCFVLALSMARNWRNAKANGIAFDMSNEFTKKFITQACALFVNGATIVGALWYSTGVVLIGFLFKCYQLVVSIMSAARNWSSDTEFFVTVAVLAGLNVLFLYATAAFMWETHRGILTKENYQRREKYSCCCEQC
eukprot:scaffold8084_cov144-Skeletonema_menzelii.AAC.5